MTAEEVGDDHCGDRVPNTGWGGRGSCILATSQVAGMTRDVQSKNHYIPETSIQDCFKKKVVRSVICYRKSQDE